MAQQRRRLVGECVAFVCSSLERSAFRKLGRKPVTAITTADMLAVVVPILHTKTATASRVKGRISSIMRWAIAQNYTGGIEPPPSTRGEALAASEIDSVRWPPTTICTAR